MKEPRNTCPDIDSAIEYAKSIIDYLEDIRSQNEGIRKWGQYWRDKHDELEKEFEEYQRSHE